MAALHPAQPVIDDDGTHRFKKNAIVCFLLNAGPFDMNAIACGNFSREDHQQFAQLIGYSVAGFGELSCSSGCPAAYAELGSTDEDNVTALREAIADDLSSAHEACEALAHTLGELL